MAALIPNINTLVELDVPDMGAGSAAVIDLTCYCYAFELTPDLETIDVGTFCDPSRQAPGRHTWTSMLSMLWEHELHEVILTVIGKPATLVYVPDTASDTPFAIYVDTMFRTQPTGRFELGQRVEIEYPVPVLAAPRYEAWTPPPLAASAPAPAVGSSAPAETAAAW